MCKINFIISWQAYALKNRTYTSLAKMTPLFKTALLFLISAYLTSCASMHSTERASVVLNNSGDPLSSDGARVYLNGKLTASDTMHIENISDKGLGQYELTFNIDKYTMGPGTSVVEIKRTHLMPWHTITVKKEGYKDQTFRIYKTIQLHYFLNIFNIIGFLTVWYSGAMWTYTPKVLDLQFEEIGD